MISIVSNNMIRFNIKSIANYLLFPKNEVHYIGGAEILPHHSPQRRKPCS